MIQRSLGPLLAFAALLATACRAPHEPAMIEAIEAPAPATASPQAISIVGRIEGAAGETRPHLRVVADLHTTESPGLGLPPRGPWARLEAWSDSTGQFAFPDVTLPGGYARLKVERGGEPLAERWVLLPWQAARLDLGTWTVFEPGNVFGRVLDSEGQPVAGVELRAALRPSNGALPGVEGRTVGVTANDGAFSLTGLPAGLTHFAASSSEHVLAWSKPIPVHPERTVGPVELRLEPGTEVRGTVRSAETDAPLEACVVARPLWGGPPCRAVSDAKGSFALSGLRAGERYSLQVETGKGAPPAPLTLQNRSAGFDAGSEQALDLQVARTSFPSLRVIDAFSKRPIPGAVLAPAGTAYRGHHGFRTEGDLQSRSAPRTDLILGRSGADGLIPAPSGALPHSLVLHAPGYSNAEPQMSWAGQAPPDPRTVSLAPLGALEITMVGQARARVDRIEVYPDPAPGRDRHDPTATVHVFPAASLAPDPSGKTLVEELPGGFHRVALFGDGQLLQTCRVLVTAGELGWLQVDQLPELVRLVGRVAPQGSSARVTAAPKGLEGQYYALEPAALQADLRPDGFFEFSGLPTGRYRLLVESDVRGPAAPCVLDNFERSARGRSVTAHLENDERHAFEDPNRLGALRGQLRSAHGPEVFRAVELFCVDMNVLTPRGSYFTVTDHLGRFDVPAMRSGTWHARILTNAGSRRPRPAAVRQLEIRPGETTELTIDLEFGSLVLEAEGGPEPERAIGSLMLVRQADGDGPELRIPIFESRSSRLALDELQPGIYYLERSSNERRRLAVEVQPGRTENRSVPPLPKR